MYFGYSQKSHITFKGHKVEEKDGKVVLFPVNSIDFSDGNDNYLATCGSDGQSHIWNYLSKNKLKSLNYNKIPVCFSKISPKGQYMAYGLGNDWHIGVEGEKWKPKLAVYKVSKSYKA